MGGNKHQQMSQDKNQNLQNEQDLDETANATPALEEMEDEWETPAKGELGGETPGLYDLDEQEDNISVTTPSPLASDEDEQDRFERVDDESGTL